MAQNVPQPFSPVPDAGASFKASYLAEYGLDYDGAIRPMTALIESDSRNYAASARLGWLHYLKGAHAESERHYKNAIRLVPTTSECRVGLMAPLLAQRKYEEVETLGRQLTQNGDGGNYWGMLRMCYAQRMQGKYEPARSLAVRMLTLYPTDVNFLVEQGYAHAARGENDAARKCFKQVQVYDPDNTWAKQFLEQVK